MATRLMSHWCEDCDRWAFECRCERRADEAAREVRYRREEIIDRGRAHPLRKSYTKLLRAMYCFENNFPELAP